VPEKKVHKSHCLLVAHSPLEKLRECKEVSSIVHTLNQNSELSFQSQSVSDNTFPKARKGTNNMTLSSHSTTLYPATLEIMATSPAIANASAVTTHANDCVEVRGDCYDVLDLYRSCIKQGKTDTPLCNAAVRGYLRCSESDK